MSRLKNLDFLFFLKSKENYISFNFVIFFKVLGNKIGYYIYF